jgi:signal transduction histidine kinase
VLERGGRLDERGAGAGLGLSIVREVLDAYGWQLQIGGSDLGGARVAIAPLSAPDFRIARPDATALRAEADNSLTSSVRSLTGSTR